MVEETTWFPCLVSDPFVFNGCVEKLRAAGILQFNSNEHDYKFEDVFTMDANEYDCLHPARESENPVALTLLFSLTPELEKRYEDLAKNKTGEPPHFLENAKNIKFMKQTVQNACGVVAILHAFANLPGCTVQTFVGNDPEKNAENFKSNKALSNCLTSTAKEFNLATECEENVIPHFVCFIPLEDKLYELDGRQRAPIDHGTIEPGHGWVKYALKQIQKIVQYDPDNFSFNLQRLTDHQLTS